MLTLRPLTEADVTQRYLAWFRDPEVTRYLDARNLTREDVLEHLYQADHYLYAICVDGVHIGNLKIGPINWKHGLSDLVTVIGDRDYWGHGYATKAIRLGVEIAWVMGIRKIAAGICRENIASTIAYTRAGFTIEGVLKDHYIVDGKPQDRVCVSAWHPALHITEPSGRATVGADHT